MLEPKTARLILNIGLIFTLVVAGLLILYAVLLLVHPQGLFLAFKTNIVFPGVEGARFQFSEIRVPAEKHPVWRVIFALLYAAAAPLLFLAALRVRAFVDRVFDDPFDARNAADLWAGSRVALVVQAVTLVAALLYGLVSRGYVERLYLDTFTPLDAFPEPTYDIAYRFNLLNPVYFIPLLIAGILTVLAAVFQRGHDLREQERGLRREQELTV